MKKTLLFISSLLTGIVGFSQTVVPNGSFESWTYTAAPSANLNNWSDTLKTIITQTLNGTPSGPTTTNYRIADSITTNVSDGSKAIVVHSNTNMGAAVPGAMVSGSNAKFSIASQLLITAPPLVISSVGTPTVSTQGQIPFGGAAAPGGLKGSYKFTSDSIKTRNHGSISVILFGNVGDTVGAYVNTALYANTAQMATSASLNIGSFQLDSTGGSNANWTAFNILFSPNSLKGYTSIPATIDSARIIVITCLPSELIGGKSTTHDSVFLDKLEFTYAPPTPTITQNGTTLTSSSASGNQWYFNGNAIAGATGQSYTAPSAGNYTVKVTSTDGLTSAASAAVAITGIEEITNNSTISVYPNPSSGNITVKSQSKIVSLEVFNTLGGSVSTLKVNADSANIDLSKESNGIYFLKVVTEKSTTTEKVVLNK